MKTTRTSKNLCIPMMVMLLAFYQDDAYAVIGNGNILDNALNNYKTAASTWGSVITSRATFLFWSLATISIVWTFGMLALRKADLGDFYSELLRFTVFTGFFWWLLSNGPTMAANIMDSMITMGGNASGNSVGKSPSGIVDTGFGMFFTMLQQTSVWSPLDSAIGVVISGIILVVLALVGVNMLILLVSGWILAYAGVFFLGFGGSQWTSDMAIAYFKTVLSVGVQTMTMVLLVGIGQSFVDQYYNNMTTGLNLNEMGVMLVASIVLLVLTNKVPPMVGQIAMGGGTHAIGNGMGTGGALGAAGMAAATMATAGAVLAAGASNMAGGAQAVMAAFSQANASVTGSDGGGLSIPDSRSNSNGASGGGSALATAMDGYTGTGSHSNSGSSQRSSVSTSSNSSGSFATNAAMVAAGTVSNLIKGSVDVAKDAAIGRINDTVGGKVAAAIDSRGSTSSNGSNESNSLSAGSDKSADLQAEVAAFRDRGD